MGHLLSNAYRLSIRDAQTTARWWREKTKDGTDVRRRKGDKEGRKDRPEREVLTAEVLTNKCCGRDLEKSQDLVVVGAGTFEVDLRFLCTSPLGTLTLSSLKVSPAYKHHSTGPHGSVTAEALTARLRTSR